MTLRRGLVFALLALVVGAAIGIGFVARPERRAAVGGDDPVVAMVNDYPIRSSYVQSRLAEATLGDQIAMREQRARFVDSLITEEMLLQSMLSTDFANEPELREQIKGAVAEHIIRKQVGEQLHVDEEEARAYYEKNQSVIRGETVRVAHIVMRTRVDCERVMAQISNEEEFAAAARKHSLHIETAPRGGALGRVMNHAGALGFEEEMFQMNEGEMRVFEAEDGCHLVRAGERDVPPVPEYETVRERIHALLRREQEVELLRDLVERLKAGVEVRRFEE